MQRATWLPAVLVLLAASGTDAAEPQLAGVSTPIIPSLCALAGDAALRCAGYGGVDVLLFGPEDARSLSLGGTRPAFPPLPVAGRLGRSVDWQLGVEGAPLAGAVRWRADEGSAELVLLLRPAAGGETGCLQAVLAPGVEPQGLSARRFRCGKDQAVLAGPVPPLLRAALEPWLAAQKP